MLAKHESGWRGAAIGTRLRTIDALEVAYDLHLYDHAAGFARSADGTIFSHPGAHHWTQD